MNDDDSSSKILTTVLESKIVNDALNKISSDEEKELVRKLLSQVVSECLDEPIARIRAALHQKTEF